MSHTLWYVKSQQWLLSDPMIACENVLNIFIVINFNNDNIERSEKNQIELINQLYRLNNTLILLT